MNLQSLQDDELLRQAHLQLNDITSTELERELLRRLEKLIDERETNTPLLSVLDDFGIDPHNVEDVQRLGAALQFEQDHDLTKAGTVLAAVLETLDADLDGIEPDELRNSLKRVIEIDALLSDLAVPIARLNTLANPATEAAATTA